MTRALLATLVLGIALAGCADDETEKIEHQIVSKVKSDAPYLAQLEAVYGVVFTNRKENMVFRDDMYIRKDKASVYYGYGLEDAEIEVVEIDGERVLRVRLPRPEQISIDRQTLQIETSSPRFKPVDTDGALVNVDKEMNEHLQSVIDNYETRTVEMTKNMSREYFLSLAQRYGLKLDLKFGERVAPPEETPSEPTEE
jgi:hypothetical protein